MSKELYRIKDSGALVSFTGLKQWFFKPVAVWTSAMDVKRQLKK